MSKHTPAPWQYTQEGNDHWIDRPQPTEKCVTYVRGICRLAFRSPSEMEISRANARLIRAAPEMLDSLRELVEICRVKCSPHDEEILPGKSNHAALVEAVRLLETITHHEPHNESSSDGDQLLPL